MTYRQALSMGADRLEKAEILFCDTPFLDSSVLLCHSAGITKEKLFASYPDDVPEDVLNEFNILLDNRISGLPVSYIRNRKEFYGRDFFVDSRVLVPRPETETLVNTALELADSIGRGRTGKLRVLDLCTGSGCVAVTLKAERPELQITAADISGAALGVAAMNANNLETEISLFESNLFENINNSFDIIVSNPPYLTSGEAQAMGAARWPEPELALDGGGDGLEIIRKIIDSSLDYLNNNSYLLIEAGPEQAGELRSLMEQAGYEDILTIKDLSGKDRVTCGRKNGTRNKKI